MLHHGPRKSTRPVSEGWYSINSKLQKGESRVRVHLGVADMTLGLTVKFWNGDA